MAKYGFVTEAGGGRGRARPWRLVSVGTRFTVDSTASHDVEVAAGALSELYHERQFQRLREWEVQRSSYPREWRRASFSSAARTYMTASELKQLEEEITSLLTQYRDRLVQPSRRPRGSSRS